jgi:RNA polymerase sigma-70 factor (sigma-E family)
MPMQAVRPHHVSGPCVLTVEALFRSRYGPMCRLAALMLGDRGAAEQVVMEAFVEVYARWSSIRDPGKVEAYLRRSVVNGATSVLRRRSLELRANALFFGRSEREVSDGFSGVPDSTVLRAVRELPHRQRAAVVLYFYEDLSEAQIAQTLGCSTGTVKSQLSKARAKLSRALQHTRVEEDERRC